MNAQKKMILVIITVLLVLLSTYQFNCMLQAHCVSSYHSKKRQLLQIVSLASLWRNHSRKRKRREFWIAPGRTSAWWESFLSRSVFEAEWKNNFRVTRASFYKLCGELRPIIQRQGTVMRSPVDVDRH